MPPLGRARKVERALSGPFISIRGAMPRLVVDQRMALPTFIDCALPLVEDCDWLT